MSQWTELLGHPQYSRMAAKLIRDREDSVRRLLEVARASADAAVRAEATKIEQQDAMLQVLHDEATRQSDE